MQTRNFPIDEFDISSIESRKCFGTECEKCGITLKDFSGICRRCKESKIFMESVNIKSADIKNKMFPLLADVSEKIPIPGIDHQVRIRTQVSMNMLALMLKIIKKHKKIDCLIIATYSLDENSLVSILSLIQSGIVKKLGVLLSDTYSYRYKKLYSKIIESFLRLKKDGFDVWLVFATTHLKITLCQCAENYYHIEGSMNYSINNLCEQILIENNKEIYDYDYEILSNLISKKKNKALRIIC